MEHNEQKPNMKDAILGKIESGSLKMHPKYYFVLRVAALVLVSIAIFLITVFLCNFLLFSIRINSSDSYLYFGPRGWGAFLAFFPWDLFAIDVVLVGVLLWLMRQFKFGYKSPMLYIVLFLIVVTVAAGAAIDRVTDINDRFLNDADHNRLPGPVNVFYVNAHRLPPPGQGVCKCVVVSAGNGTLRVYDLRASTTPFTVTLPLNDPRATTSGLEPGDTIFIAGERVGSTIDAFGVRKIYFAQPGQQMK
jgi:hypothetical protein